MNAGNARRLFAQSFSAAYPRPWLLVLILALAAVLTAVGVWRGFPSYPPENTDALHALLAGLPAVLGTLFVLAFTFTLVTGQIASNYSRILYYRILGPWVVWYAVPFAAGILLPLYLLNGHFFLWAVQVSLSAGAYCVLSLLPFAVAVRVLLSVETALDDRANQIPVVGSASGVRTLAREIGDISVGALTLRDFAAFERGVRRLVSSTDLAEATNLRLPIAQEIRRMMLRNPNDAYAAEILIDAIVDVALGEAAADKPTTSELLNEILSAYRSVNIAVFWNQDKAIERVSDLAQHQQWAVSKCQSILLVIGERAISATPTDSGSANLVIVALGKLLQCHIVSLEHNPGDEQDMLTALVQIENLGDRAKLHNNINLSDLAITQLHVASQSCSEDRASARRLLEGAIARLEKQ